MSKYWSNTIQKLKPYTPGEQPKEGIYIKLNTNENPYPPSPAVLGVIQQAANPSLRLYPDPQCSDFREVLARYHGLKQEQVFVGNGSDEILAFAFLAFFNPGKKILFPDITYSFYEVYAEIFRLSYELVALDDQFNISIESYFKDNGGVIFPNPNAPTGKYLPIDSIKELLEYNTESVVIVDEAYIDFGGESAAKYLDAYPNLLVVRTYSKSRSLAGLRIGYAIGHKDLIEGLERVKNSINSYTLDRIALAAAVESVKDEQYFQAAKQRIIATRESTIDALSSLGFQVLPSKANFIFISHTGLPASSLFQKLREKGILVRYFNKPRIDNYLRVSIGTDGEMDSFVSAVQAIIAGV